MTGRKIGRLPDSKFAFIESGGRLDAEGKTTPRTLRHFPIDTKHHAASSLASALQSPFGKLALPKIIAACHKHGIEVPLDIQDRLPDPASIIYSSPKGARAIAEQTSRIVERRRKELNAMTAAMLCSRITASADKQVRGRTGLDDHLELGIPKREREHQPRPRPVTVTYKRADTPPNSAAPPR